MNFDEKYSELMRNVLFERQGSIVLYPGGFKPPHKGHFEALKYLQSKFDGQLGVVFIGAPEREGVTAQHSQKIWEIYGNYLEFPIETEISPISPVKSVYDYADEHKNEMIIVGAGEEDMARYNYFNKNILLPHLKNLTTLPFLIFQHVSKLAYDEDFRALIFVPGNILPRRIILLLSPFIFPIFRFTLKFRIVYLILHKS